MKYKIYTDGACSGNPGPGGWAAIIIINEKIINEISGSEKNTTNNNVCYGYSCHGSRSYC